MSWTYQPELLASDPVTQVRYLVGDTINAKQQVQNEEIAFAISQRPGIYGAAALVCRSLATQLSREADTVDQNLRTTLSARATAYSRRADAYETQDQQFSAPMPYGGGLSVTDKARQVADSDRVKPQFNIGMEDNFIPVGPAGNETSSTADSDT